MMMLLKMLKKQKMNTYMLVLLGQLLDFVEGFFLLVLEFSLLFFDVTDRSVDDALVLTCLLFGSKFGFLLPH